MGFEPTSTEVSPTYTCPEVGGSTIKLSCHIRGNSVPRLPNIRYLLVITAITDSVTPGSWRGFVQDFLKPIRLFL